MTNFLFLLLVVLGLFAVCLLAMAVGVIFRNRGFTSCGGASVTINGERVTCPSCQDRGEPVGPVKRCRLQPQKACDGDGLCGGN